MISVFKDTVNNSNFDIQKESNVDITHSDR